MKLALRQARKGQGRTSPNPCVGAVIVKDNEIIARGYHQKAGTPHAETHALNRAGTNAVNATLYVTLEPCNHVGRTPPCSHAIADSGISKVVIGMLDPNPLVDGGGAEYLRRKGVTVVSGVAEEECRELNRPFLKYISSSLPWVMMKAGISLDGRIAYKIGAGGAITGPESFKAVHRLRDSVDAILVGIGTIEADDPSLTTRLEHKKGHDPIRIILDTELRISQNARVLKQASSSPSWIFCSKRVDEKRVKKLESDAITIHRVDTVEQQRLDLNHVLRIAAQHEVLSILVEGGAAIHGAFLNQRLVDRAYLFFAPLFVGDSGMPLITGHQGIEGKEQAIRLKKIKTRRCGDDMLIIGDVSYP